MSKIKLQVSAEKTVLDAVKGVGAKMGVSTSRAAELILAAWLVEHGWLDDPEEAMRRTMSAGQQVSGFWVPRSPPDGGKAAPPAGAADPACTCGGAPHDERCPGLPPGDFRTRQVLAEEADYAAATQYTPYKPPDAAR